MIGRDAEVSRIERLLADARAGRSAALVVSGEPGIGKTALLQHARERATGLRVLEAAGTEAESHLPFAGLGDLLGPAVDHIGSIPGPQADALRGALALGPPRPGDRFTVYAATLSLLAAASEDGPLLCVVDDAHWLDTESLEAIRFAARRIEAEGIAILLAARDGARTAIDVSPLERIPLAGLDGPDAARLLAQRAPVPPAPEVATALIDGAAGNPLALIELAGGLSAAQMQGRAPLPDPLPVGPYLQRALLREARGLPPGTRRALLVASADDGAAGLLAEALAASGLGMADLEPAERAGLVDLRPTGVAFAHPLLRAAVYQAAPAPDRRRVHRALAEAARARGDGTGLDRRAWHLALAAEGPDEPTAAEMEAAGTRAATRNGHAAACQALEAAARLSPGAADRGRRLLTAGQNALAAGDLAKAGRLFDEVIEDDADPIQVLGAMVGRGHVEMHGGSTLRAVNLLVAAAQRLERTSPAGAAALLVEATRPAFMRTDPAGAAALLERSEALAPDGPPDVVAFRDVAASVVSSTYGRHLREPAPQTTDYLAQQISAGDPRGALWSMTYLQSLVCMERYDEAEAGFGAFIRGARERSAPSLLPLPLVSRAEIRRRTGSIDEAAADAAESARLARDTGQDATRGLAGWTLARIAAMRGDAETCRTHVEDMLTARDTSQATNLVLYAHQALGLLALGEGRLAEAVAHFEVSERRYREMGVELNPLLDVYVQDLAEALVREGRREEADAVVTRIERDAALTGLAWPAAIARRCRGLMAPVEGFEEEFAAALDLDDRVRMPFETARTALCLGERRRRARRNRDAREPLASALATFDALGATLWADRARRELRAAGGRIPGGRPAGADQLTPQELQVALAVAEGATNKEAATALLISPKTVEYHLAKVFGKLGVRSRAELAARMARGTSQDLRHARRD